MVRVAISTMPKIGTLNEKPLHASLKKWIAQPGDQFEVAVDGYVIDIVRGDLLLEIQTGNFAAMKTKLEALVRTHRIHLIYPIAQEKWIIKQAKTEDNKEARRKSPKRGRVEDLFWELVSFPHLLLHKNFTLEVLMVQAEEVQQYDGTVNWRRKGWRIEERRLLNVAGQHIYEKPQDLLDSMPESLGKTFTAKELGKEIGIRKELAQKMVYCLRKMNAIELVGKKERANLYKQR